MRNLKMALGKLFLLLLLATSFLSQAAFSEVHAQLFSQAAYSIIDAQTVAVSGGEMSALNITHSVPLGVIAKNYPAGSKTIADAFGNNFLSIYQARPGATYSYIVNSTVEVNRSRVRSLPETYVPPANYSLYLASDRLVDASSPGIRELALSITENATSDFEKVALLASWVHGKIKYDTSLVGREVNANDILADPRGVCTEYSTLFISFARSIGIPARYVNGYAYSDMFGSWLGHSWAEVWLGEWVGVDPTWLEVGDIDATHISSVKKPTLGFATSAVTAMVYPPTATIMFNQPPGSGGIKADNVRLLDSFVEKPDGSYRTFVSAPSLPAGGKFLAWIELPSEEYRAMKIGLAPCKGEQDFITLDASERLAITAPSSKLYVIWEGIASPSLPDSYRFSCPITVNSPYLEAKTIPVNISTADAISWQAPVVFLENPSPSAGSMQAVRVQYKKAYAGQKITMLSQERMLAAVQKSTDTMFVFPAGSPGKHKLWVFAPQGDPFPLEYYVSPDTGYSLEIVGLNRSGFEGDENVLHIDVVPPQESKDNSTRRIDVEWGGQRLVAGEIPIENGHTRLDIPFTPHTSGDFLLVARLYSQGAQIASSSSLISVSPAPSAEVYKVASDASTPGRLRVSFLASKPTAIQDLALRVGSLEVPFAGDFADVSLERGKYNATLVWSSDGSTHSNNFSFEVTEPPQGNAPQLPAKPLIGDGKGSSEPATPAISLTYHGNELPLALACPVIAVIVLIPLALLFRKKAIPPKKGL